MNKEFIISFYLDARHEKSNGKFPLKIRVYHTLLKNTKFYPTNFDFTDAEFKSIESKRPRKEYKDIRLKLRAIEAKANEVAEKIQPFSFEQFERKLIRNAGDGQSVVYHYNQIIQTFEKLYHYGTASNYINSRNSIIDYIKQKINKNPKTLLFSEITQSWLNRYEQFMIEEKGRSRTTVSMYLRSLRAVFNKARSEGEIDMELYPFGRRKYQIPNPRGVKKALKHEQLSKLFNAEPQTPEQRKARDFFFFSYACNGMNMKDISLLRWENLKDDKLTFYRAKTINTSKGDLKEIVIYLNDYIRSIIDRYGDRDSRFIFQIISENQSKKDQYDTIMNFTRFVNQHLKKLAIIEGLPAEISTYWARHSFVFNRLKSGASLEFVSELLNHSDLKTTQKYASGFADEDKKELSKILMNF